MVAVRADFATAASVSLLGVVPPAISLSELSSGVVGREFVADEKGGRRREVSDGEGGKGVGGRL